MLITEAAANDASARPHRAELRLKPHPVVFHFPNHRRFILPNPGSNQDVTGKNKIVRTQQKVFT